MKYFFQPGQKLICQRQNRPISDFGLLSYFARSLQLPQLLFAIVLSSAKQNIQVKFAGVGSGPVFQSFICFFTDLMKRPNALSFFRLSRYDIS
jgi:hypothetical protein